MIPMQQKQTGTATAWAASPCTRTMFLCLTRERLTRIHATVVAGWDEHGVPCRLRAFVGSCWASLRCLSGVLLSTVRGLSATCAFSAASLVGDLWFGRVVGGFTEYRFSCSFLTRCPLATLSSVEEWGSYFHLFYPQTDAFLGQDRKDTFCGWLSAPL